MVLSLNAHGCRMVMTRLRTPVLWTYFYFVWVLAPQVNGKDAHPLFEYLKSKQTGENSAPIELSASTPPHIQLQA